MPWTAPKDWIDGEQVDPADLNEQIRDNLKSLSEWTTYTPSWAGTGGTPSIGNGTLTGRYLKAGNLCHVAVAMSWGSTTTANSATDWKFGLPSGVSWASATGPGIAYLGDWATQGQVGAVRLSTGNTFIIIPHGSWAWLGATTPWTWTNQDALEASLTLHCTA